MKRNVLAFPGIAAVTVAGLLAAGCVSKKEHEQVKSENVKLTEEKQKLEQKVTAATGETAEMNATLDEVQKALEDLRGQELKVIKSSIEVVQEGKPQSTRREQLQSELDTLKKAVKENLAKLEKLEKERKAAQAKAAALGEKSAVLEGKVTALERFVAEMKRALEEKEALIAELETKVLNLTQTVETQAGVIKEKETVIDTQTKEINKAWVAIATKTTLREKGIVEKKGSVAGLGGNWLETGKIDPELFKEIDIRQDKEFAIAAPLKKVRVLSDHPKDSYELVAAEDPKATTLKVTDPARFWTGSKKLVVMMD